MSLGEPVFVVMERHGIREALTTDAHFEQAGFRRLLVAVESPRPSASDRPG